MNKQYGFRVSAIAILVMVLSTLFSTVAMADSPRGNERDAFGGKGSISGVVYQDWDQDGERDEEEPALAEAEVTLFDLMGNEIARIVTEDDGTYAIEDLRQGGYILVEIAPLGYSLVDDGESDTVETPLLVADGEAVEINFGHVLLLGMRDASPAEISVSAAIL